MRDHFVGIVMNSSSRSVWGVTTTAWSYSLFKDGYQWSGKWKVVRAKTGNPVERDAFYLPPNWQPICCG